MQFVKQFLVAVAIALTFPILPSARAAGIPVLDASNLAQAIQQVAAWGKQYQQQFEQIQNQIQQIRRLQDTLENMTGSRALGLILDNMANDETIPDDVKQQLEILQDAVDLVATVKGIADTGQEATAKRAQQIKDLMARINATEDQKGIGEIQARIGAETAAVQNDTNRIELLKLQQKMEAERINNQIRQEATEMTQSTVVPVVDFTTIVPNLNR